MKSIGPYVISAIPVPAAPHAPPGRAGEAGPFSTDPVVAGGQPGVAAGVRPPAPALTLHGIDRLTGMPVLLHRLNEFVVPAPLPESASLLPVYEVDVWDGQPYAVTELPLSATPATHPGAAALGALRALSALHAAGQVHGNVNAAQLWQVGREVRLAGAGLPWSREGSPGADLAALGQALDSLGARPAALDDLETQSAAQALSTLEEALYGQRPAERTPARPTPTPPPGAAVALPPAEVPRSALWQRPAEDPDAAAPMQALTSPPVREPGRPAPIQSVPPQPMPIQPVEATPPAFQAQSPAPATPAARPPAAASRAQPVQSQPVQSQPEPNPPVPSLPVQPRPVETQRAETQPVEIQPVQRQPAPERSVPEQPVQEQPAQAPQPIPQAAAAQTAPVQLPPAQLSYAQLPPSQVAPSQAPAPQQPQAQPVRPQLSRKAARRQEQAARKAQAPAPAEHGAPSGPAAPPTPADLSPVPLSPAPPSSAQPLPSVQEAEAPVSYRSAHDVIVIGEPPAPEHPAPEHPPSEAPPSGTPPAPMPQPAPRPGTQADTPAALPSVASPAPASLAPARPIPAPIRIGFGETGFDDVPPLPSDWTPQVAQTGPDAAAGTDAGPVVVAEPGTDAAPVAQPLPAFGPAALPRPQQSAGPEAEEQGAVNQTAVTSARHQPLRIGWEEDHSWRVVKSGPERGRPQASSPTGSAPTGRGGPGRGLPRSAVMALAAVVVLGGAAFWWRGQAATPAGCCSQNFTVSGSRQTVKVTLVKAPPGSPLTPGGVVGTAPGVLKFPDAPGSYTLKFEAAGHGALTGVVTVPSNQAFDIVLK